MSHEPRPHACTIHGIAVTATFHYISREFGEASLDRVVSELGDAYRETLDLDLLLAEHVDERVVVPVKLIIDVTERVGERYLANAGGALALAERTGAFAAYEAQSLLRRVVINLSNPQALIRRAASLWLHYYSCGVLRAEELPDKRVRLSVEGFHDAHPLWCRRLTAYYREVLQRSSGRRARMHEVECVTQGAPRCAWEGDWSGASLF